MRIAFFTDNFLPQVNGVVVSVISLAKWMADRGHRVYIVAPKLAGKIEFSYPNITVKLCSGIPLGFYEGARFTLPINPSVISFLRDEDVDIIHMHTAFTIGIQAILMAKLCKKPLIGSFHTFFASKEVLKNARLDNKLVEGTVWRWMIACYNKCDFVVCSSQGVQEELLRKGLAAKVRVIPQSIDFSAFDNVKAKSLKAKYNPEGKLVLFVGRVAYEKNVSFLIDCFAFVSKSVPSAKFIIVGEGPQFNDTVALARRLGIQDKVIFTGKIEHGELLKSGIFGACDVFVNASITETGPITVLEAQANGLVCVTMESKGMSLVRNGVNGYVIDPINKAGFAKAIVKLLTNKAVYKRMRKATLQEVEKYSAKRIIGVWERTYSGAVSAKAYPRK